MDVKSAREGLEIMEKYPKVVALMKDLLRYNDVMESGKGDAEVAYEAQLNGFKAWYTNYRKVKDISRNPEYNMGTI